MRRIWFNSFATMHRPMLCWLAAVALGAITVALVIHHARDGIVALLAIPVLLLAGLATALAEIVQAIRHRWGDHVAIIARVGGTLGLGVVALPVTLALAFATLWLADWTAIIGNFPTYGRIVAETQSGAIAASQEWQSRYDVRFLAETRPNLRVVFPLVGNSYRQNSIVYDPTGSVAMAEPATSDGAARRTDLRHRIAGSTVHDCHATLVTAYYRCDLWGYDED